MSDKIQIKLKCKVCNEVLEPDAQFCHGCGLQIVTEPSSDIPETLLQTGNELNKTDSDTSDPARNYISLLDQSTGMEFVFVQGGSFMMGDIWNNGAQDEKPVHKVMVSDFYIGKFTVTQGVWNSIMGANPSHFKLGSDYPVEQVSWNDVQVFIKKLNELSGRGYRLPTEAEWEYAARSRGQQEQWSGTDNEKCLDEYVWFAENSSISTHPVGEKCPNSLGIHDMSGNVNEWCSDYYDPGYYRYSSKTNPLGEPEGWYRVARGGSWVNDSRYIKTTNRFYYDPAQRHSYLGFRLVCPS